MAMFLDVRCENLIFLGSPRTLLQTHLFTTRSSHHLCALAFMVKKKIVQRKMEECRSSTSTCQSSQTPASQFFSLFPLQLRFQRPVCWLFILGYSARHDQNGPTIGKTYFHIQTIQQFPRRLFLSLTHAQKIIIIILLFLHIYKVRLGSGKDFMVCHFVK